MESLPVFDGKDEKSEESKLKLQPRFTIPIRTEEEEWMMFYRSYLEPLEE